MAKRAYETADYADMLERMVRAYGRRVGDGDDVDLTRMMEVRSAFDAAVREAVQGQRRRFSWDFIARAMGVTRSAAHQRFSK